MHTEEVSFNETNFDWSNVLSQLTNTDGVIDQVKTWRNTYAADLVVMIVNDTAYCGIGWLMIPSYTYELGRVQPCIPCLCHRLLFIRPRDRSQYGCTS